ncbi:archease [Patescibacteria group bacterium]
MKKFEFLSHPADLKMQSYGHDLPELFSNAALGMMSALYDTGNVEKYRSDKISIEAPDQEALLVDWLSEILMLSDTNDMAYTDFQISEITANKITAKISGGSAPAKDDIKAVTYSELAIKKDKNNYEATIVFDI